MTRKKITETPAPKPTTVVGVQIGVASYDALMNFLHTGVHSVLDNGIEMNGDGEDALGVSVATQIIGAAILMKKSGASRLVIDFNDLIDTGDTPR